MGQQRVVQACGEGVPQLTQHAGPVGSGLHLIRETRRTQSSVSARTAAAGRTPDEHRDHTRRPLFMGLSEPFNQDNRLP